MFRRNSKSRARSVAAIALLALAGAVGAVAKEDVETATFQVRHELKITVPEGAKRVGVWFAYPQGDPAQTVSDMKIETPYKHSLGKDSMGNQVLYVEAVDPTQKEFTIVESFRLVRREVRSGVDAKNAKPLTDADRAKYAQALAPNTNVVINDEIRALAKQIVGDETNPVIASRKIYDWVLANVDYWVKDPANKKASPVGSSEYCLSTKTGNCTDFHSLWTSLARASGIPTTMVYGSFLKAELNGQDRDQSYHCWPEFYASGIGWVPHDVAVADIFVGDFVLTAENTEKVRLTTADGYTAADPKKVDYYFGNLDDRRVTWSRGRDLTLDPPQAGGPVNALAKAYVEVDGKPADEKTVWNRKLTYQEIQ